MKFGALRGFDFSVLYLKNIDTRLQLITIRKSYMGIPLEQQLMLQIITASFPHMSYQVEP